MFSVRFFRRNLMQKATSIFWWISRKSIFQDYADNYFNLKFSLEDLLKRNVDLLKKKHWKILISLKALIIKRNWFIDNGIAKFGGLIFRIQLMEIKSYFDGRFRFWKISNEQRSKEQLREILKSQKQSIDFKERWKFSITDSIKIIGLRNRIIHAYDFISDVLIWSALTESLPILQKK